jgi:hypothetical protein
MQRQRGGLRGIFLSAYWAVVSFFSNFKHSFPEAWKTMDEGISRDLKPRARHPRGKFLSQVMKKWRHLKQSIFSSFMTERSHEAPRG